MVRVVSQNFSPPRSRHSSGETDRDLAERANLALSTLGRKRVEAHECESSSDSFWDSEFDGDHCDTVVSENGENSNDINGNKASEKSDVQVKRKERRRERNKLSAQAYRQRRRSQHVKEQQTLQQLEMENKRLHKIVETLEKKTEQAKQYLLGRSVPVPDILLPIGEVEGACAESPELPSPCPNINEVNAHLPPTGAHHDSHLKHDLSTPSPDLALPHPSASGLHESHKPNPMSTNCNAPSMGLFTTSNQPSPTVSPTPSPQFILNANTLIGATFSPTTVTDMSAVSSFLAIPVENQNQKSLNANLRFNPIRTCPPPSESSIDSPTPDHHGATSSQDAAAGLWWNVSGNPVMPSGATVLSLVRCNNNMNSRPINSNDANGNNSCDQNINMQSKSSPQLMSFNLNLNQAPVMERHQTTHQSGPHQEMNQNPSMSQVSLQYLVTPSDQAKSVSVQ